MKKYWFALFTCIIFNSCSAQKGNDLLKNIDYYTPTSNKWTLEIKLFGDSLFMLNKKGGDIEDKRQSKIMEEEERGKYFFIYLKSDPSSKIPSIAKSYKYPPTQRFSVCVLYFSKDKETLFLLSEPMGYNSIEEAKTAYSTIQLGDKYFNTWYSETKYISFTHYPDISIADKAQVQKVADEWVADLKQNANKIHHTKSFSWSDNLSKALIDNHLNPLGGMIDFNNKLMEYHIALPSFPSKNTTLKPDPNRSKSQYDDDAIIKIN